MDFSFLAYFIYLIFFLFVLYVLAVILKSKKVYRIIWTKLKLNQIKKVKYNAAENDPEAEKIDGNARLYPNCPSDLWLRSCEQEVIEPVEGRVSGTIPTWLNGSLLRNGPGNWKVGEMTFSHLFDCSALVHRFCIKNGQVTYQNRFVQTETLKKNRAAQRIVVTEFGTASVPDPCHSIFDKVSSIFRPDSGSDNSMISIYPFGDEYYTFTETPCIHRLNPRTLETEGRVNLNECIGIVNHTSHPHVLPNGTVYNLGMISTKFGPAYNIICFPRGEKMFEDAYIVGSIPCRWKFNPGYMHTFGITDNFFVIVEQPLSVSLPELIKAQLTNKNLCACLKWFENKPTLFHLMDRKTGKVIYTFESETFFYMHIINQYEEDNHVVIDICCYKDPGMINCMYRDSILNMQSNPNYAALFRGRPLRFVLPLQKEAQKSPSGDTPKKPLLKSFSLSGISAHLQTSKQKYHETHYEHIESMTTNCRNGSYSSKKDDKQIDGNLMFDNLENLVTLKNSQAEAYQTTERKIFVRPELLCDIGCETPRVHYERYLGKKYRYFYAISCDVDAENPGMLIKVDAYTKTCKTWYEPNSFPSEPIFVPALNAEAEDDGVVLASMIFSGMNENRVALLVLCAKTWTELGRCVFQTNGPIPKCLHGWFAKDIV